MHPAFVPFTPLAVLQGELDRIANEAAAEAQPRWDALAAAAVAARASRDLLAVVDLLHQRRELIERTAGRIKLRSKLAVQAAVVGLWLEQSAAAMIVARLTRTVDDFAARQISKTAALQEELEAAAQVRADIDDEFVRLVEGAL